jgi:hypothetical protein
VLSRVFRVPEQKHRLDGFRVSATHTICARRGCRNDAVPPSLTCEKCRALLGKGRPQPKPRKPRKPRKRSPPKWLRTTQRLASALADRVQALELFDELPEEQRELVLRQPSGMKRPHGEVISAECFRRITWLVRSGTRVSSALRQCGVGPWRFATYLRHEPRLAQRFAAAKLAAWGRRWSQDRIEDALRRISAGASAREAFRAAGLSVNQLKHWRRFVRTHGLERRYLAAAECRRTVILEGLRSETNVAPLTRATRRSINQRLARLRTLEPRRT